MLLGGRGLSLQAAYDFPVLHCRFPVRGKKFPVLSSREFARERAEFLVCQGDKTYRRGRICRNSLLISLLAGNLRPRPVRLRLRHQPRSPEFQRLCPNRRKRPRSVGFCGSGNQRSAVWSLCILIFASGLQCPLYHFRECRSPNDRDQFENVRDRFEKPSGPTFGTPERNRGLEGPAP